MNQRFSSVVYEQILFQILSVREQDIFLDKLSSFYRTYFYPVEMIVFLILLSSYHNFEDI